MLLKAYSLLCTFIHSQSDLQLGPGRIWQGLYLQLRSYSWIPDHLSNCLVDKSVGCFHRPFSSMNGSKAELIIFPSGPFSVLLWGNAISNTLSCSRQNSYPCLLYVLHHMELVTMFCQIYLLNIIPIWLPFIPTHLPSFSHHYYYPGVSLHSPYCSQVISILHS